MAMTGSLSGSYSTFVNARPEKTRVNNASINWDQYNFYFSWRGKSLSLLSGLVNASRASGRNNTLADITQLFRGYGTGMVPDGDDVAIYDGFHIGTPSLFNLDQSMIQSILANVTLSVIAQYHARPTSAHVTCSRAHSKYVFSNPLNLPLPYFLSLGIIPSPPIVGYWALCQKGVPARNSGPFANRHDHGRK